MIEVSSAEFLKQPGRVRDMAQGGPVLVTSRRGQSVVLLSVEEYRRLKSLDRESFYIWELSDEDIEAMARSEAPEEAKQFDHEVE